jgi:hypothetical protein
MLDILDRKTGRVVAVLMDDGSVIKKENSAKDIDDLIKEKLKEIGEKGTSK